MDHSPSEYRYRPWSTQRLQQADRIFQGALERPPAERSAYLLRVCGPDDTLRLKVRSLLAADDRAQTFLERRPPPRSRADLSGRGPKGRRDPRKDVEERGVLGPFQLLRLIGRGGMSRVYLAAHQDAPTRPVALKLLHRGLDDAETLRRFRRERRVLARLRHPYIAGLRGGGTTPDGRPYLVMEYVDGWPVDEYCERRRLGIRERLELFGKVLSAVAYAHSHHLVHRDLKPDNILVTAGGTPKLLDFGIAKLLDRAMLDCTVETTTAGVRLMTPGYASPEQVLGRRITPASDVYALGVVLYRLLTGHGPYGATGDPPHELGLAICRRRPLPPSAVVERGRLRRRLRGDLDAIVGKALRKDPSLRYASAAELAADLTDHLQNFPVSAVQGSPAYRWRKRIGRHPVVSLLVVSALLFGLGWLAAL